MKKDSQTEIVGIAENICHLTQFTVRSAEHINLKLVQDVKKKPQKPENFVLFVDLNFNF
jgi:hypothetical protein